MEPGESTIHLNLPEPAPFKPKRRRPLTYQAFLIDKLKERPTRPTCCTRMLPLRHAIIYLVIVSTILAECFGIGYFFWRVVLPKSSWIESPDTVQILFTGWMLNAGLFAAFVFFTWAQTMIAIFCCGRGLDNWPR